VISARRVDPGFICLIIHTSKEIDNKHEADNNLLGISTAHIGQVHGIFLKKKKK
jgi:hypothetical protein